MSETINELSLNDLLKELLNEKALAAYHPHYVLGKNNDGTVGDVRMVDEDYRDILGKVIEKHTELFPEMMRGEIIIDALPWGIVFSFEATLEIIAKSSKEDGAVAVDDFLTRLSESVKQMTA